jgi:hypothetical protein
MILFDEMRQKLISAVHPTPLHVTAHDDPATHHSALWLATDPSVNLETFLRHCTISSDINKLEDDHVADTSNGRDSFLIRTSPLAKLLIDFQCYANFAATAGLSESEKNAILHQIKEKVSALLRNPSIRFDCGIEYTRQRNSHVHFDNGLDFSAADFTNAPKFLTELIMAGMRFREPLNLTPAFKATIKHGYEQRKNIVKLQNYLAHHGCSKDQQHGISVCYREIPVLQQHLDKLAELLDSVFASALTSEQQQQLTNILIKLSGLNKFSIDIANTDVQEKITQLKTSIDSFHNMVAADTSASSAMSFFRSHFAKPLELDNCLRHIATVLTTQELSEVLQPS